MFSVRIHYESGFSDENFQRWPSLGKWFGFDGGTLLPKNKKCFLRWHLEWVSWAKRRRKMKFSCSIQCSTVSENFVVTAAHCLLLHSTNEISALWVLVGRDNVTFFGMIWCPWCQSHCSTLSFVFNFQIQSMTRITPTIIKCIRWYRMRSTTPKHLPMTLV